MNSNFQWLAFSLTRYSFWIWTYFSISKIRHCIGLRYEAHFSKWSVRTILYRHNFVFLLETFLFVCPWAYYAFIMCLIWRKAIDRVDITSDLRKILFQKIWTCFDFVLQYINYIWMNDTNLKQNDKRIRSHCDVLRSLLCIVFHYSK